MKDNTGKITTVSLSVRVFLGLLLILSLVFFATKLMQYNKLAREIEELEKKIDATEEQVADLQHDLDAPMDDSYVERYAKDNLDMNYPDETVYYNNGRQ